MLHPEYTRTNNSIAKKTNNLIIKWTKDMNRHSPEEILVTSVQMNINKIYREDEEYYVLARLQGRGTTCKVMARCELV